MFAFVTRFLLGALMFTPVAAHATPDDLDTTFGNKGVVIAAISGSYDSARAVALQPDGKIVVAGDCGNVASNGYDICLARYHTNGAPDTSFNGSGKVTIESATRFNYARALAVQSDGNILVAGVCTDGSASGFCLTRYLTNGALDTTFNGTGVVVDKAGSAAAIALQADNKIVVAGICRNGNKVDFCLARYLANGALDISFNSTGKVVTPISGGSDVATSLKLQPDGKIVVAGHCAFDFCVARYQADGSLDTSFNRIGTVSTPISAAPNIAAAHALQSDGKIVVAGHCGQAAAFCLARYHANGALDTGFNGTGKVITSIGRLHARAYALSLQPDGKIVVAGECDNGNNYKFCVARYLASGVLDTSFTDTGSVLTSVGPFNDTAYALAMQPDGKLVVAGTCQTSSATPVFCLVRYEGGPNTPKTLTEYFYSPLNYYFLTSRDNEKAVLDASPGWARTGQSFTSRTFADPGTRGISRYYFDQIAKNQTRGSHFYTLVDSEKTALNALNLTNQLAPRLPYNEGIDSYAFPPVIEGVGGSCAAGQTPVYRVFRGQARFPDDPNHRFTTSVALYDQLVAQGWEGEGVKMCAPN